MIAAGALREHFEGARLQRVADEDRGGFIEGAMAGGAAAAQVVVVHGRQVVVHQAVDVNELDRGGRGVEHFQRRAERFAGGIHEHRTHAFAARERAVAHRFEQARGRGAFDIERAREHALDALLVERNAVGQENRRRRRARLQRPAVSSTSSSSSSSSANGSIGFLAVAGQQHFHFLLRGAQRGLALARERHAALECLERLFERHVALFELRHEGFELGQRMFEVRKLVSGSLWGLISRARR